MGAIDQGTAGMEPRGHRRIGILFERVGRNFADTKRPFFDRLAATSGVLAFTSATSGMLDAVTIGQGGFITITHFVFRLVLVQETRKK